MLGKILSLPNDDTRKVVVVALSLCLVCSLIVSAAAVYLRPMQEANKTQDMKKNILSVAGLLEAGTNIDETFAERIEVRIVDLRSGEYATDIDAEGFDQRAAERDTAASESLTKDQDVAGIGRISHYAPVYLLKDGDQTKAVILPVHGYGLWSTMYGFLALEPDLNTVSGITFYAHGETPGLGGEIDNPDWQASWVGRQAFNGAGAASLEVVKGQVIEGNPNEIHQIDGLSGATLTSKGVSNTMQFWLGENGFGPFLAKLSETGV